MIFFGTFRTMTKGTGADELWSQGSIEAWLMLTGVHYLPTFLSSCQMLYVVIFSLNIHCLLLVAWSFDALMIAMLDGPSTNIFTLNVNKCKNLAPFLPALIINQSIKPTEDWFRLRSEVVTILAIVLQHNSENIIRVSTWEYRFQNCWVNKKKGVSLCMS